MAIVKTADKKPQIYVDPNTGKKKVRMVPVDKEIIKTDERKLTPAELKKREKVAKAIERENPNMPMDKKMAIATATAKKESVEEVYRSRGIDYHQRRAAKYRELDHELRHEREPRRHPNDQGPSDAKKAYYRRMVAKMQAAAKKDPKGDFRKEESDLGEKIGGPMTMNRDGKKIHLVKKDNQWHLTVDGKKTVHDSEKKAMQHTARLSMKKEETVNELSRDTLSSYKTKASDASKHKGLPVKKVDNRYTGVSRASKRLDAKEETVNELSPATMKSYQAKAADDKPRQQRIAKDYATRTGDNKSDWTDKMAKVHKRAADNRAKGLATVKMKLNKEEVEMSNEKDYVEEGKKSSAQNQKILRTIGSAQNMDQAIQMVMKSHNADEAKAKKLVHRAVKSAFYGESVEEASWRKETPWRKVTGPRKDKFGNVVKDKNVSKNLARSAMKKTAAGKTEGAMSKDKEKHDTGGFRISNADAKAASDRLAAKRKQKAQNEAKQPTGLIIHMKHKETGKVVKSIHPGTHMAVKDAQAHIASMKKKGYEVHKKSLQF